MPSSHVHVQLFSSPLGGVFQLTDVFKATDIASAILKCNPQFLRYDAET